MDKHFALPLPNVEHPGRLDQHDVSPVLEALETDVEQRPVPVVVVEAAELGPARAKLVPQRPREGHAHVVLGGDPRRHVDLTMVKKSDSDFCDGELPRVSKIWVWQEGLARLEHHAE